jgi:hypothetical protein
MIKLRKETEKLEEGRVMTLKAPGGTLVALWRMPAKSSSEQSFV